MTPFGPYLHNVEYMEEMHREDYFFPPLLFQKYRPVATEADHAAHPSAAPGKFQYSCFLQDVLLCLQRKQGISYSCSCSPTSPILSPSLSFFSGPFYLPFPSS